RRSPPARPDPRPPGPRHRRSGRWRRGARCSCAPRARTAADRAQLPPGAGDRPAPARRRASAASPSSPPAPRPRPPALALAPARRPGAGPARGLLDVPTELEIDPQVSDRNVVVNVVPLDLGGDAIVEPVLGEGARALPGHGLGEAELK